MPSTITHAYIGIDTLKLLNTKPKNIIQNNINNYKIYCQNMDILYFYHLLLLKKNKIQDLGHRFHNENVFNSFELLINDNKKNKNHELFTFIAGLITHYKADSIIHPFIDYYAHNDKKVLQINKHFEFETYIDNYFIKKNETNDYKKINNSKLVFNYTKKQIIKDEINKLFQTFFNADNIGQKYYQALKEMAFVFKHIRYDKYGIKKHLYQFIDILPLNIRKTKYLSYHFNLDNDNYYLNLKHNTWFNYKNKKLTSNKSFLELYNDVTIESAYIINKLYEYIFENKQVNLRKLIGNNSYSSGLPISPE